MDLECNIADFLGIESKIESSIFYSQGLSTTLCVITAFAKNFVVLFTDSIVMTLKV